MKRLSQTAAIQAVETYHACWSNADVKGMMQLCHPDVELKLNNAAPDGTTLHMVGKLDIAAFLLPILDLAVCTNVPLHPAYRDGAVRTQIEATIMHRRTGHTLQGTYRQIVQFDGPKIIGLDEFHDVAMMRTFWALVRGDEKLARARNEAADRG